jgi:antitoxin ParD1/3/4
MSGGNDMSDLEDKREKLLAKLDRAIEQGRADVAAGRIKPADEVFERLDAKYRAMMKLEGKQ